MPDQDDLKLYYFDVIFDFECGCHMTFLVQAPDMVQAMSGASGAIMMAAPDPKHFFDDDGSPIYPQTSTIVMVPEEEALARDVRDYSAVITPALIVADAEDAPGIPPGLRDLQGRWNAAPWN